MKSLLLSLALLPLLGTGVSIAQTPIELDAILENMATGGREFRSLEADIEKTKVTVFVNVSSTDFGKVYFAGSGDDSRIRVTISEPAEQHLLVADGKAQLYRPRIDLLEEYDLGDRGDMAEFLVIGFGASNQTLRDDYNVALEGETMLEGIQTSVLRLEPKSERLAALFPTIQLWVDQSRWIPVQARLNEAGGDYQIVKYSSIVLNGRIPSGIFELDIGKYFDR